MVLNMLKSEQSHASGSGWERGPCLKEIDAQKIKAFQLTSRLLCGNSVVAPDVRSYVGGIRRTPILLVMEGTFHRAVLVFN